MATKTRSLAYRAILIFLLLGFVCILLFMLIRETTVLKYSPNLSLLDGSKIVFIEIYNPRIPFGLIRKKNSGIESKFESFYRLPIRFGPGHSRDSNRNVARIVKYRGRYFLGNDPSLLAYILKSQEMNIDTKDKFKELLNDIFVLFYGNPGNKNSAFSDNREILLTGKELTKDFFRCSGEISKRECNTIKHSLKTSFFKEKARKSEIHKASYKFTSHLFVMDTTRNFVIEEYSVSYDNRTKTVNILEKGYFCQSGHHNN